MADRSELDYVRAVIGAQLSDGDAQVLAANYATLARAVAAFATDDLRGVEPPLRSIAGPLGARVDEART